MGIPQEQLGDLAFWYIVWFSEQTYLELRNASSLT